jgi:hypothetical protein
VAPPAPNLETPTTGCLSSLERPSAITSPIVFAVPPKRIVISTALVGNFS